AAPDRRPTTRGKEKNSTSWLRWEKAGGWAARPWRTMRLTSVPVCFILDHTPKLVCTSYLYEVSSPGMSGISTPNRVLYFSISVLYLQNIKKRTAPDSRYGPFLVRTVIRKRPSGALSAAKSAAPGASPEAAAPGEPSSAGAAAEAAPAGTAEAASKPAAP